MNAKQKTQIEKLIADLKSNGYLTATGFFRAARSTTWGAASKTLVEDYNESLGRMFGRGQLSFDEVNRAMQP